MLEQAYSYLFIGTLICLGIAAFAALIRSITGKTMISRFIGTNILSTITLIAICVLAIISMVQAVMPASSSMRASSPVTIEQGTPSP